MPRRQRTREEVLDMMAKDTRGKRKPVKKAPPKPKETRAQEMDRGVMRPATRLGQILMSGRDTTPDERN